MFLFTVNIQLYLSSYILMSLHRSCMAPLNRLPCYGALEIMVTLFLFIIIIIIIMFGERTISERRQPGGARYELRVQRALRT